MMKQKLMILGVIWTFALVTTTSFADEVRQGDHFSGISVAALLEHRVYNLEDDLCIQKTVLNSPTHQAHIAVGAYLDSLSFDKIATDSATGQQGLVITATYNYDFKQVQEKRDLGFCIFKK